MIQYPTKRMRLYNTSEFKNEWCEELCCGNCESLSDVAKFRGFLDFSDLCEKYKKAPIEYLHQSVINKILRPFYINLHGLRTTISNVKEVFEGEKDQVERILEAFDGNGKLPFPLVMLHGIKHFEILGGIKRMTVGYVKNISIPVKLIREMK